MICENFRKRWCSAFAVCCALVGAPSAFACAPLADDVDADGVVTAAFLALSTGPGRGYPSVHVLAQCDALILLKRKTDWIKVRGVTLTSSDRRVIRDGRQLDRIVGWVHREALVAAVAGERAIVDSMLQTRTGAAKRPRVGVMTGDFGGAASVGGYFSWPLSEHLAVRASGAQLLGRRSDGWVGHVDVVMQPWPAARISPFVALGGGVVQVEPQTTLIASQDRRNEMAHVGIGVRGRLAHRFFVQLEYEQFHVFTQRDTNEEIRRWQVGFSAHF